MLAAVLKDFNNLVLEEVPTPAPGPGEVLVRIKSCGFCATDYKAIKGIRRNVTFPLIPGHEPSGVIAAVGPGVTHFREGDEVICQPSGYCGVCEACRMGNTHYCEHAYTTVGDGPEDVRPGAFAEYMVTGEEQFGGCKLEGLKLCESHEDNDRYFYEEPAEAGTILLKEGDLIVVEPEEAHKPRLVAGGEKKAVKKVVVKVAV